MTQCMLAIWSLVPLPFLNPTCTSRSSRFTYGWSLAWRILSIILLTWNECSCTVIWTFFGVGMKTDHFQSCGYCWVFQICWHIECSTLTASSFKIWNSSAAVPTPPLALFIVILLKVHLTSDSRMSGCRWMTTSLWLSGSLRVFLYSSSVYSCYLFLISKNRDINTGMWSYVFTTLKWKYEVGLLYG